MRQSARRKDGPACNGAGSPDGLMTKHSRGSRCKTVIPMDLVFDSGAPIQIDEVGAAPEQRADSCRRSRPSRCSYERRPPVQASLSVTPSGLRRAHPAAGQPNHAAQWRQKWKLEAEKSHHNGRFRYPLPRMLSFSRIVRETRSVNVVAGCHFSPQRLAIDRDQYPECRLTIFCVHQGINSSPA